MAETESPVLEPGEPEVQEEPTALPEEGEPSDPVEPPEPPPPAEPEVRIALDEFVATTPQLQGMPLSIRAAALAAVRMFALREGARLLRPQERSAWNMLLQQTLTYAP